MIFVEFDNSRVSFDLSSSVRWLKFENQRFEL